MNFQREKVTLDTHSSSEVFRIKNRKNTFSKPVERKSFAGFERQRRLSGFGASRRLRANEPDGKEPSLSDAEAGCEEGESRACPFILPHGNPSWMITVPNDNDDDYNGEAAADDDDDDDEGGR